jgi:antitoxin component YwqK of YwqJK toxin-antitoxin module
MLNKQPLNDKGQAHGHWEVYHKNGQLCYKGEFINDQQHGLWITYYSNGNLWYKETFIMGQLDGLIEWYNKDGLIREIRFYAR